MFKFSFTIHAIFGCTLRTHMKKQPQAALAKGKRKIFGLCLWLAVKILCSRHAWLTTYFSFYVYANLLAGKRNFVKCIQCRVSDIQLDPWNESYFTIILKKTSVRSEVRRNNEYKRRFIHPSLPSTVSLSKKSRWG